VPPSWTCCPRLARLHAGRLRRRLHEHGGTHLNWGASYLVNDFYKRFLKTDGAEKHYVAVSRAATILSSSPPSGHLPALERREGVGAPPRLGAGTGLVLILRWYWWRINAWSEISAMIASSW
jgi:Na+/proline symporter